MDAVDVDPFPVAISVVNEVSCSVKTSDIDDDSVVTSDDQGIRIDNGRCCLPCPAYKHGCQLALLVDLVQVYDLCFVSM